MFLMGEVPIFSTVIRLLSGFVFILSNDCLKVIQFLTVVILLNFSYGKNFIVLFIAFSCKFVKLIFKLNFIFNLSFDFKYERFIRFFYAYSLI